MKSGKRFGVLAITFAAFFGAAVFVGNAAGVRINTTHSAPVGLWLSKSATEFKKRDLVEVCPPALPIVSIMAEKGYLKAGGCEAGVMPMLKPIAAIEGDTVEIKEGNWAEVNGFELKNTAAMEALPAWRPGIYKVKKGEVWLFSTYSKNSFDSRYFGPVSIENIKGSAAPILVTGQVADMTIAR